MSQGIGIYTHLYSLAVQAGFYGDAIECFLSSGRSGFDPRPGMVQRCFSSPVTLSFIGTLSKGLFNTASMDDVNFLACHMNKLNKMATNLARALTQHEDHLSSSWKQQIQEWTI